jgi:probable rRNA maturation factor
MADRQIPIDIAIRIEADGWRVPELRAEDRTREAASAALEIALRGSARVELSILLTDNETIAALNRRWRGQSGPTNVLSFPGENQTDPRLELDAPLLLGDVVIALETVIAEADVTGIPVSHHFSHLVVHGVLHLLAYDHQEERDADRMERCETEILAKLSVPDPHAAPSQRVEYC